MSQHTHGGIVLLSHAGTDLTALGRARWPEDFCPVTGIALQQITDEHHMQQLLDGQLSGARILLLRVLGRVQAIPAFDALRQQAIAHHQALIVLSGTGEPDPELAGLSTVATAIQQDANAYLQAGGSGNMAQLMRYLSDRLLLTGHGYLPPAALPEHGLYHPELSDGCSLDDWCAIRQPGWPTVAISFYRAHWLSGNTRFIDMLVDMLAERQINALPAGRCRPGWAARR